MSHLRQILEHRQKAIGGVITLTENLGLTVMPIKDLWTDDQTLYIEGVCCLHAIRRSDRWFTSDKRQFIFNERLIYELWICEDSIHFDVRSIGKVTLSLK